MSIHDATPRLCAAVPTADLRPAGISARPSHPSSRLRLSEPELR